MMRTRFVVLMLATAMGSALACGRPSPTAPPPAQSATQSSAAADTGASVDRSGRSALTLVDVTAGSTGTSNNYVGQSVTIPGHASYHGIGFNWYTYGASPSPTAFGTLYLLDAEYLGPPDLLSPSTPGFIAASESIVGGQYLFDSKVKIKGGHQYWFYTDAMGAFATGFSGSTYDGGDMYVTGMPTLPFHLALAAPTVYIDANFRLQVKVD
jgi:hypothetical protein